MRRLVLLAIALGASGCFPDYSVGDTSGSGGSGAVAGMEYIDANGADFAWSVDHYTQTPIPFSAEFDYDFEMDVYEVTVGRFRAWAENPGNNYVLPCADCSLDEGGPYESEMLWREDWKTTATNAIHTRGAGCDAVEEAQYGEVTTWELGNDALPMTCVTWPEAVAFCAFEGKRLPTEVEWLFVASSAGTTTYPWGDDWVDCGDATINYDADEDYPEECSFPVAAGTADGETKTGVKDMGGSVFEWVWDATWYNPGSDWPTGEKNYSGPSVSTAPDEARLRNGGAFFDKPGAARLRTDRFESGASGTDFFSDHGFRCVRSVK